METIIRIEGMMCMRCAGRVQKALEALPGVTAVSVSHESGTAAVTSAAPIAEELLKETVENAGYTYKGIQA